MTAMSPGCRRLVKRFVRASTRAGPTTIGSGRLWRRWAAISAAPLAGCSRQQFLGVVPRRGAGRLTRQHARKLDDSLAFADDPGGRDRAPALVLLGDGDLVVGEGRH